MNSVLPREKSPGICTNQFLFVFRWTLKEGPADNVALNAMKGLLKYSKCKMEVFTEIIRTNDIAITVKLITFVFSKKMKDEKI